MAFLPDGRAVVTERDSRRVLIVDPEGGDPVVAGEVDEAVPQGEAGLLGVAVSPDFARDRLLYFYVSAASRQPDLRADARHGRHPRSAPRSSSTASPSGSIHDGGRMEFGPDGFLYASTGETGDGALAQDLDSLGGKILRITPDGGPAPGNPDPDSPIWSLRPPQRPGPRLRRRRPVVGQ